MFDSLSEKLSNAFRHMRGKAAISEENIEETLKEVRTALLEADVNFKVVKEFVAKVKEQAIGQKVLRGVDPGQQFVKLMHDQLTALMGEEAQEYPALQKKQLQPFFVVGLNGAGKTTFSAKFALFLRNKKKSNVYLVPADTFRPAAKEQLLVLAKNIGIDYFDSDLSLPPQKIVELALAEARRLGKDAVIIDTAGRLHVDEQLMQELVEVKKNISHQYPNPEVLLVADAMTGQEAVNVANTFHQALQLNGVVLSKMDSDARGGAALSIRYVTNVPIRFFSTGEKMKDLEIFHPDRLAKRILDMGDVLTLVEKAEEAIDRDEAERMMKNLERDNFTLDDFMKQMGTMKKLGSMGQILKMLPGMGDVMRQVGDLSPAEAEMQRMTVMISSMTLQERFNYKLLSDNSRIQRIAGGSGTRPEEVKDFLRKFEQMRKMLSGIMKMMKGGMPNIPGFPGMPGMPGMKGMQSKPAGKGGRGMKGENPFEDFLPTDPHNSKKKKGKGRGPFGGGFF